MAGQFEQMESAISCSTFLSVIVFCAVCSFHQGPIQTSLAEQGTQDKYRLK